MKRDSVPAAYALVLAFLLAACGGKGAEAPKHQQTVLPPANPVAVGKMVQAVQIAKDPGGRSRAIALLKEAVKIDPGLWEAHYDLGVLLANDGDLAGSEGELAIANKTYPDAQEVAVALAEIRRRRGEDKAAADDLGQFVESHPDALQARTVYVAALRESGQLDKAIAQAREVLVRKPADPDALSELALCHLARGEKDTAALLAKQATDANPKSASAARATALIALAAGDNLVAFDAFSRAASLDPTDTTARLNMGAVLLKSGAYPLAEQQYRQILQVSPDDAEAMVGLAAALRGEGDDQHTGKFDEARGLLDKVLQKDPHNVSALFNMGVLQADFIKKPNDATPYFKRFLSDAPSDHPMRKAAEGYLAGNK